MEHLKACNKTAIQKTISMPITENQSENRPQPLVTHLSNPHVQIMIPKSYSLSKQQLTVRTVCFFDFPNSSFFMQGLAFSFSHFVLARRGFRHLLPTAGNGI